MVYTVVSLHLKKDFGVPTDCMSKANWCFKVYDPCPIPITSINSKYNTLKGQCAQTLLILRVNQQIDSFTWCYIKPGRELPLPCDMPSDIWISRKLKFRS